jgi:Transposase IS116/IS110/IS902 family
VLEDANVKIGNVLSDVFGISGQAMLEALLENKRSAKEIAELAHWRLESKIPQLVEAFDGHRMSDHHRFLIRQSLDHLRQIERMISEFDEEIEKRLKPYQKQVELACTVPGIGRAAAASILAEIGMDMSPDGPFPGCHQLASWSAICPGNNESAGKRGNGPTRKGNRWLKATLIQTAWAGAAKKRVVTGRIVRWMSASEEKALKEKIEQQGKQIQVLGDKLEKALAENERLRKELEEALRSLKRQAAPFSKNQPKANPKPPGRKPGHQYGRRGSRPVPAGINETYPAPLPGGCLHCGGRVEYLETKPQFQEEIVRATIIRRFNVEISRCCQCGRPNVV